MRIALIGHTYILDANRGKLAPIADACDGFVYLAPAAWPEPDFGPREFEHGDHPIGVSLAVVDAGDVYGWRFLDDALKEAVAGFQPDLVHVETEAGSRAARQTIDIARASGARVTQFVWENIPHGLSRRRLAQRANYRDIDHLFCGSSSALAAARADGYRGAASVVAQVGVNAAAIDATEARRLFEPGVFVVGVAARLDPKKGVADVIDAVAMLGEAAAIVIVGDGAQREALQARAARHGLGERARFVGAVTHAEVPAYIKGCDAFVLASRDTRGWREQFGHVLIEAMAAGVPVVGSDGGAIPEIVGDAGAIFSQGDAGALAARLVELRDNAPWRARCAAAGRERVMAKYSDGAIAAHLVGVWRDLLGEPAASDPPGVRESNGDE
ncbi:glycosyltransferase [bacterium]|nr:glycosyltransferase [bacterium]